MSYFTRIKEIIAGLIVALFGILLMLSGDEGKVTVVIVISFYLLFSGFRLLWYYVRMARHMVGGKNVLIRSIITLDFGLVTVTMISMSNVTILIYLLGIFAFTGVIDILRALESKRNGGAWKFKLINGFFYIFFSISLIVSGLFLDQPKYLVYAFGATLIYSGIVRIVTAFRRSAIVYIQ